MNQLIETYVGPLQERFAELEARERYALILLSGFLLIVVFYLAIWTPLNGYVESSASDRDRHLSLLQYFKSTEAEAKASAGNKGPATLSGQSLLSEVSRSAQSVGINPSRMQPEGTDAVSVWFDNVTFTRLMLWLERLESGKGIVVRQISMERQDRAGQVSARLVLRQ